MKAHERCSLHSQASQALLVLIKHGLVVQQLQRVCMQEREKNKAAMKSLLCCTHFVIQHHIAHSTSCRILCVKNCKFSLNIFQGMQDTLLEWQWLTFGSIWNVGREVYFEKATQVKELSVFCRWEEDGTLVEWFLDIVPLKKADAK